jgi:ribosomal protein S18 acetylase RimI-like enzyme
MKLEFQKCNQNNLKELTQISRETFITAFASQNNPEDFEYYINNAFSVETIDTELKNIASHFYFVYLKKELIGYFKLNEFDAQNELQEADGVELERIYVISKYQGKGLGAQILQKILDTAIKKQKQYIWLGVWEHNLDAIRFYEKHGFTKFDTHPYYVGKDKQTDWLMRKKL